MHRLGAPAQIIVTSANRSNPTPPPTSRPMTMPDLPFSSLTPNMRARVAYLFADQSFGSDPDAFVYELDNQGEITRKIKVMTPNNKYPVRVGGRLSLLLFTEQNPTREQQLRANLTYVRLADLIGRQIHLEVHACIHQV